MLFDSNSRSENSKLIVFYFILCLIIVLAIVIFWQSNSIKKRMTNFRMPWILTLVFSSNKLTTAPSFVYSWLKTNIGRFLLTDALLSWIVKWYHKFLTFTEGDKHLYKMISQHFFHPRKWQTAMEHSNNCVSQKWMVKGHQQVSYLAPQIATCTPWEEEVHIDCIGNWSFKILKNLTFKVQAFTLYNHCYHC